RRRRSGSPRATHEGEGHVPGVAGRAPLHSSLTAPGRGRRGHPRTANRMEALLAFAAALVAFRLAGNLASRWRATRRAELAAWSTSLLAYAVAAGALAWGAAAGWKQ